MHQQLQQWTHCVPFTTSRSLSEIAFSPISILRRLRQDKVHCSAFTHLPSSFIFYSDFGGRVGPGWAWVAFKWFSALYSIRRASAITFLHGFALILPEKFGYNLLQLPRRFMLSHAPCFCRELCPCVRCTCEVSNTHTKRNTLTANGNATAPRVSNSHYFSLENSNASTSSVGNGSETCATHWAHRTYPCSKPNPSSIHRPPSIKRSYEIHLRQSLNTRGSRLQAKLIPSYHQLRTLLAPSAV